MKQNSTKILVALIAIIILVGACMIGIKGLAFELSKQNAKKIEVGLGKQFEEKDIKEITNEVFGKQSVIIEPIEVYKDAVSITTLEITEEQKINLITKINERYGTELVAENIEIEQKFHVKGRDMIEPYIKPFVIISVVVLVYLAIRYNKLNVLKVLGQSLGIIVLSQVVLLGIMAITRMPIGKFTAPAVLIVYILSTYICTKKFEEDLEKIKIEKVKEK